MTVIKSGLIKPIFCLTSSTKIPNVSLDCFGKKKKTYTCLTSTNRQNEQPLAEASIY